ncbi:beta-ketoacyl synthase [Micromonospora rosaria]|uniref:Beta-ketoacyl synthase n=1 Tax=Micromonospora rosaria TaxID=47874 RepID=A0A136PZE3_9ACTN|nr:ketosynthase chain-length factor [Micromonospora rosaria]KXK63825.1 beta-ketoacyl synthase [Micromonospora rosaria]
MTTATVTGIGVAAPTGVGLAAYWSATVAGKGAIDVIGAYDASGYPSRLAGEVRDLDAVERVPKKLRPQTDHMTHMALVAAEEALADAGIDPLAWPEYEMGVITANSAGGTVFGQRELQKLWTRGPLHVSAYMSVAWFYAATTGQLSIRHQMRGPCGVLAADQAGGLDALGQARRVLRGGTRMVLAGGTDAPMSPAGLTAQIATRLLSRSDDPARAYLPFDSAAGGFVPAEGGAMMTVEDAAAARGRGVRGYGVIAGYAATFDPPPGSARPPALGRAIVRALADAGVRPDEVDVVLADAAGVPALDRAEADALRGVFGPRGVPVTAPKTTTGRMYAGAGPLDVVTALLAIRDGVIPPTVNVAEPAPEYQLDLVCGAARPARLATALVLARGHGGFNSAVVVRGPDR